MTRREILWTGPELAAIDRVAGRIGPGPEVRALVEAAYQLYALAWPDRTMDTWARPEAELDNIAAGRPGPHFHGYEPWDRLLQAALQQAQTDYHRRYPEYA